MILQLKIKVLFLFLLMGYGIFGQQGKVGINTEDPTRTLHVEGNMKIIDIADRPSHQRILVADGQGNIDYILKSDLSPTLPNFNKKVWNMYYSTTDGYSVTNNVLQTEHFEFRFNREQGSQDSQRGRIQFRLRNAPSTNTLIYTSVEQTFATGGFEYQANRLPFTFTAANSWRSIVSDTSNNVSTGEMNEAYISYPGANAFYRLIFYRVRQAYGGRNYDEWIMTAELF